MDALRWYFEFRGPDDTVENEATEVFVPPVFVEMWHDDPESSTVVGAFDAPGHGLRFRIVWWQHGSSKRFDIGCHTIARTEIVVVIRLVVQCKLFHTVRDCVLWSSGGDGSGRKNLREGLMVLATAVSKIATGPAE